MMRLPAPLPTATQGTRHVLEVTHFGTLLCVFEPPGARSARQLSPPSRDAMPRWLGLHQRSLTIGVLRG